MSPDVGSSRSENRWMSPDAGGRWLPFWLPEESLAMLTSERSGPHLCRHTTPAGSHTPVWEDRPRRPGDGPDRIRLPGDGKDATDRTSRNRDQISGQPAA